MLEVGKKYVHALGSEENSYFLITERFSKYFVGQWVNDECNEGQTWLFDENGKAVGINGAGYSPNFSIKEIPLEEKVYVRLNRWGDTSVSDKQHFGSSVVDIELTFVDGIATSACLRKANEDKANISSMING